MCRSHDTCKKSHDNSERSHDVRKVKYCLIILFGLVSKKVKIVANIKADSSCLLMSNNN